MKKLYKKLTDEQIKRGVIFSSCLSINTIEQSNDTIHEIFKIKEEDFKELKKTIEENNEKINRLLDDKFFNQSHFKFNIIRQ